MYKSDSGCGGVVVLFFMFLAMSIVGLVVYSQFSDSETNRLNAQSRLVVEQARARAIILEAQGQARLDSAFASQMLSNAALPWGVIMVLGLLGLAVVALVGYLASRRPTVQEYQKIIYLAHPAWVVLPDQQAGPPVLVAGRESQSKITTHKRD